MNRDKKFILLLRSRFLDAVNNVLMQFQNPNLENDYETKEELIEMMQTEAKYLQQKRDKVMAEINTYLTLR